MAGHDWNEDEDDDWDENEDMDTDDDGDGAEAEAEDEPGCRMWSTHAPNDQNLWEEN